MKRVLLTITLLCGLLAMQAQTAADCFRALPDSLLPLLTPINRADCIDFLESKMRAEVTNTLGSKSEMTHLTADYLRLQITKRSTWEMKLLPVNDSVKVVCAIHTVCAPMCGSSVRFYTTRWEELDASDYLPAFPAAGNFLLLMKADLSATEPTMTCTFTTPDELSEPTKTTAKELLDTPKVYRWQGSRFQ